MKKTKRIASVCMTVAMCSVTAFSAACQASESLVKDGKTLNVSLLNAGYGVDYIYEIKTKFEEAFASEGYKLNILTPRAGYSGNVIAQDIAAGSEVDVFFSAGFTEKVLKDYPDVVSDITESVFNQKPLNFKGEEEGELTVAQKLAQNNYEYTAYQKADGTYYALPYQKGIRGLAVNTGVLDEYDLEIPKTSNEFFHCYEVIMAQAAETGVFPITHIATSNNYPCSFTNCWLAQYEGYDWYQQFISFQKKDGTNLTKDEAVAMFDSDGIEYMLTNMYRALDPNCGTYGSASQGLEKAQAKFMNGSCAFMMNGDWMLRETYASFSDTQRNDITFVNVPVLSELGVKVFKDAYSKTEAECETILRAIIDEVDKNKSLEEIKTTVDAALSMNIALEDIEEVAYARGYTYMETCDVGAIINPNSELQDVAALLLRLCASDDGGKVFAKHIYSSSPFANDYETNRYAWVNSAREIVTSRYFQGVRPEAKGYKKTLHADFVDLFPRTGLYVHLAITGEGVSVYNPETLVKVGSEEIYKTSAQALQKTNYDAVKDNYNDQW